MGSQLTRKGGKGVGPAVRSTVLNRHLPNEVMKRWGPVGRMENSPSLSSDAHSVAQLLCNMGLVP